jgi:hypothetical protein
VYETSKSSSTESLNGKEYPSSHTDATEIVVKGHGVGQDTSGLTQEAVSKGEMIHIRHDSDATSTSPPSASSQSLKWRLRVANSDTASDDLSDAESNTGCDDGSGGGDKTSFNNPTLERAKSGYHSNQGPSWDEWDEPGTSVHLNPIISIGKKVTFAYPSLI